MAQTNNFTLWKCQHMKQKIQKAQQDLTSQFNNTTKIMPLCADIKNMYTELPHEEILKSIKFMLRRCQQKTRRKHVTLERKKRGEIHLGKTNAVTSTTHVTLSFDKIFDICKYDIENTYFESLGTLLHQTRGVPMGSPGSPSYAICMCTYYEHLLHEKLKRFEHNGEIYDCTPITKGMRYIDDLLVFLAWDKSDAKPNDLADAI